MVTTNNVVISSVILGQLPYPPSPHWPFSSASANSKTCLWQINDFFRPFNGRWQIALFRWSLVFCRLFGSMPKSTTRIPGKKCSPSRLCKCFHCKFFSCFSLILTAVHRLQLPHKHRWLLLLIVSLVRPCFIYFCVIAPSNMLFFVEEAARSSFIFGKCHSSANNNIKCATTEYDEQQKIGFSEPNWNCWKV